MLTSVRAYLIRDWRNWTLYVPGVLMWIIVIFLYFSGIRTTP